MIFSKIINLFRLSGAPGGEPGDLVALITRPIHNIGLSSYVTIYKVHWAANVSLFCFLTTCVFLAIELVVAIEDLDRFFESFSVLTFCGIGILKLLSLRKNHQNWRKLLNKISMLENIQLSKDLISHAEYESESEEENNFSASIKLYTNKYTNTGAILTTIYSFTAAIYIMSPYVEHFLCKMHGLDCPGYPHIFPVSAPLADLNIFGYIVSILCEFVGAVYCVTVHVAFDLTAIGIMTFICGQFSSLRDFSSRIGGKGKQCKFSRNRDDRAHYRIVRCHQINCLLVNSITELDKLLTNIIGVYFFLDTLTLCSVAVRLKSENMGIMQLISLIQYMCGTLIQLFLFCRYADAVFHESSMGMGEGPFAAASWCLSLRVRRELTILGAGMMIPRHLRAGPFNFLDLPSFIIVLRTAYSYFAVLGKSNN